MKFLVVIILIISSIVEARHAVCKLRTCAMVSGDKWIWTVLNKVSAPTERNWAVIPNLSLKFQFKCHQMVNTDHAIARKCRLLLSVKDCCSAFQYNSGKSIKHEIHGSSIFYGLLYRSGFSKDPACNIKAQNKVHKSWENNMISFLCPIWYFWKNSTTI